ncbi:MAG: dimethylargininase, partial [Myxococcota bacterium]
MATEPVDGGDIDACYACDVALVVPRGVILLRPGKALRAGETAAMAATLRNLDVPIIGAIEALGSVEGG